MAFTQRQGNAKGKRAMARSHPGSWRERDSTFDPFVRAAREAGYRVPVNWTGIETYERAKEIKRGLHRSGRFLRESVGADITRCDDGTFCVSFQCYPREDARKFIRDSGRWNGGR
jgi:hypothetical protein